MHKHLNNKGYLLVEIILASVLAMVIAYFMTDLTIKLKNKNDDLLVKTLVATDQAIIYNTIMRDIYDGSSEFSCSNLSVDGNKFIYKGFTNIMSKYVELKEEEIYCFYDGINAEIKIPLSVKQLPNENFDVNITYNFTY